MARATFAAVVVLVLCFVFSTEAGRQLKQQPSITPSLMMTRAGSKVNSPCSATVVLRNADGTPVVGATVQAQWGDAAPITLQSATGRYSSMTAPSSTPSCSFKVLSVQVAGVAVALPAGAPLSRSIKWT